MSINYLDMSFISDLKKAETLSFLGDKKLTNYNAGLGITSILETTLMENKGLNKDHLLYLDLAATANNIELTLNDTSSLEHLSGYQIEITMEGLSFTLSKMWDSVKEVVKQATKSLALFFEKLYQNIDITILRLNKLSKKIKESVAANIKPIDKNEIRINKPHLIAFSGKIGTRSVINGLTSLRHITKEVYTSFVKILDEDTNNYIKTLSKASSIKTNEDAVEIINDLNRSSEKVLHEFKRSIEGIIFSGDQVLKGKTVYNDEVITRLIIRVEDADGIKHYKGEKEVFPLNIKEMEEYIKRSLELLEIIKKAYPRVDNIKRNRETLLKMGDILIKDIDKGKVNINHTHTQTLLKKVQHDTLLPIGKFTSHVLQVIHVLVSMIEQSNEVYVRASAEV